MSPKAVVVGAGINGLTAALNLARAGWSVEVLEREDTIGGKCRSAQLFPGTVSDLGAAAFPFGAQTLDADWVRAPRPVAHPLARNTALIDALGRDQKAWDALHLPVARDVDKHLANILGPTMLRVPPHPVAMARFGVRGALPATALGNLLFRTEEAKALLVGNAVHSMSSPTRPLTAAFGVLFGALAQANGWPVARGGAQTVAETLAAQARDAGVTIRTGVEVETLPQADAVVLNMTAREAQRFGARPLHPGPGVFKVDWLLNNPVPWRDPRVGQAATVHVGGTAAEIAHAEKQIARGLMPNRPFVMVCQQYVADPSRGTTLWTYAHVPHGYTGDATGHIARQIKRFAPGFRDCVEDTHVTGYIEDIAGGEMSVRQMVFRHPHHVAGGVFLASGSTAPGAGVHGMAGLWAAQAVLKRAQ
ncbi:NAD(P)/FAD-dependent oxidoreductase [Corynebacterium sanguinis]|uniref:phytoene desaturase family protein n=1 Tax=Corynebacterium sanguinis TaxID=2594913 RepID=UPI00223BF27B|nr:NAD(P)/FAD-dependent oxidoreductase [Corynebacterium sanguinis]MCT1663551.1 NAD(P)/FAD-dependent oxidoreductase [Corynebacterium sanguinis]